MHAHTHVRTDAIAHARMLAADSQHHMRGQTIHYVTAAARRALDAAQPSVLAGGDEYGDR